MSLGLFELSSISERRIDQMLDPNRRAIRPFLAGMQVSNQAS